MFNYENYCSRVTPTVAINTPCNSGNSAELAVFIWQNFCQCRIYQDHAAEEFMPFKLKFTESKGKTTRKDMNYPTMMHKCVFW